MLGDRLRAVRELRGFTQEELATLIEENPLQVWRWENNKNIPNGVVLGKIARTLGVNGNYLLELSDDPFLALEENDLSSLERITIAAWRRGDIVGAIRSIISEGDE